LLGGAASLQFENSSSWIVKSISVDDSKSNGFIGNNHAAYVQNDIDSNYKYSYQDNPSIGLLQNVVDSNPLTYFEYESIFINRADIEARGAKEYEFLYSYEEKTQNSASTKYKSWLADTAQQGVKLVLSFKSDRAQKANNISIIPFWGTDQNPNAELKVTRVVAIDSLAKEVDLINEPIYIGSSVIPSTIESSKNYFYDKVKLVFPEVTTSEIQVYMEQVDSNNIKVKHMYWKPLPSSGRLSALNTQTRFDPSALSSLGFGEIQYNTFDLVPSITRPNIYKEQSDLSVKQINVTYKDQEKADVYTITFQRQSGGSLVKYYYTNSFTGFESLEKQQEKAASTDSSLAWKAESKEAVDRVKDYIDSKISSGEWSSLNFQNISIETIKAAFNPKTYTASISLKKDYEIYTAKRFAIGIRSIDIGYHVYAPKAEFVSNTYEFPYDIKNLTISLDSKVDYKSTNPNEQLIKVYVSLDEAKNWIRISPIENPFIGIPEVLSFNEFIQSGEKVGGVGYYNNPAIPVETKRVKVKIEIFKPRYANVSPVIYSYKLMGRVEQS